MDRPPSRLAFDIPSCVPIESGKPVTQFDVDLEDWGGPTLHIEVVPQIVGFHVPDRSAERHGFQPGILGGDCSRCGFVVGWMTACGRPLADELHKLAVQELGPLASPSPPPPPDEKTHLRTGEASS